MKSTATEAASQTQISPLYLRAAKLDRIGMSLLRLGLVVVLFWIGGLKFAKYEADSVVPLVANSPFLRFLYNRPAPEYRRFTNKEGELIDAHRRWHETNGTYRFSYGLGCAIIFIGFLIALHPFRPRLAVIGSFLLIFMSLTTLSFLVTTPEVWVPALGDAAHGFPFLSIGGRLLIKDLIMFGAAITTMADSAKTFLRVTEHKGATL